MNCRAKFAVVRTLALATRSFAQAELDPQLHDTDAPLRFALPLGGSGLGSELSSRSSTQATRP